MNVEREEISAGRYIAANNLLTQIKKTKALTLQQKRTLWGQALHGDLAGAYKGFERLMKGDNHDD